MALKVIAKELRVDFNSYVAENGTLLIDKLSNAIVLHDGRTPGGVPLLAETDLSNYITYDSDIRALSISSSGPIIGDSVSTNS